MLQYIQWVVFFICVVVDSHSILRTPASWNTRESKRAPCGGAAVGTRTGATNVAPSSTITSEWEVTAGDGNGPITLRYAKTDALNWETTPLQVTMGANGTPQRGTGKYPFTFTAPPDGCTGGTDGKSCHIQVKSTSNWYSCTTLSMQAAVVAPTKQPTPAPTITAATRSPTKAPTPQQSENVCMTLGTADAAKLTGTICQGVQYKPISMRRTDNVDRLLTVARDAFANIAKTIVFRNGDDATCKGWFAQIACASAFPTCTSDTATLTTCKSRCKVAMSTCDLDPIHAGVPFFDCESATYPAGTTSDVYGSCQMNVPKRVIHLKSRLVGVAGSYWQSGKTFLDLQVYTGDKVAFQYTKDASDVWKFASPTAYDNCDFTGATQIQGTCDGNTCLAEWTTPANVMEGGQSAYFGSKVANACTAGGLTPQKMKATVVELPMGSTTAKIVGTNPDTISNPASPPTPLPVTTFYTQPPTTTFDSGSFPIASVMPFVAFACSIVVSFFN